MPETKREAAARLDFEFTAPHFAEPGSVYTRCDRTYIGAIDGSVTTSIMRVWCRACLLGLERDVRAQITSPLSQR